jgi:hypothetical protein
VTEATSFPPLLALPEGPAKTAALAAWFQGLYPEGAQLPVLVGGAAVEIYCGGGYVTGDLDFVGEVPPSVVRRLREVGFRRKGRRWVHEAGQVFLELPGSQIAPEEMTAQVQVGEWRVLALSPEDVLVDRLAAWRFWKSPVDGIAAFSLWQAVSGRLDLERVARAAERRGVAAALGRLKSLVEGTGPPEPAELQRWAETFP